ncbi:hypothetical protein CRG98_007651 [Punica granatum]|uniref:Uncharacterized protein n=1 Tax=Punica granatum TaxID=22663 RepID=A0A2I0KU22_PUNGR|nr:hypothetical protein CRG98_007651 [Punica granatum]
MPTVASLPFLDVPAVCFFDGSPSFFFDGPSILPNLTPTSSFFTASISSEKEEVEKSRGRLCAKPILVEEFLGEIRSPVCPVSAPHFGPLAPIEDALLKLGSLFTIGPIEANIRAQGQGPQRRGRGRQKSTEGNRKSKQITSPKTTEAGTVTLFIVESLER